MPYGQDPTTPSDDALKRRGGYGKDPTTPPIAAPSTDRSQPSLLERQRRGEAPEGPERETAGQAFSELRHGTLQGAGADLLRGSREIVSGAGNLLGNFFKWLSLPPTQERAQARGEFFGQLGDIGTFLSGGLTNPLIPQQAAGLRQGINVTPPRVAEAPRPSPALPPPFPIPTPGAAPISTGAGIIPPRQAGTMTSPAATPGGASTVGPPAPLVQAPGPAFGRTPAEIGGALAGRDLPPRAPGTEGRAPLSPERQARQQAQQPPIIPEGAERGHPSQLASAFASNDASFPSRALTRQFRTIAGRGALPRSGRGLDLQDQQITTAVDTLIEGKDRVRFTDPRDPTGNTLLPSGRVPQNLDQFVQGIDHLKTEIFKEYDQLARGQGTRVDLAPTIAKLRELAASPTSEDFTPNVARAALDMADRLAMRGSYSPLEAQNAIQTMNAQLKSFLSGRTTTQEVFSSPTLTNQVRDTLLGSLNSTMERALGDPRYQILRMRYGALSSIEGNVANALAREMTKKPGIFSKTFTAGELYGLLHGTLTMNPKIFGTVAVAEASRRLTGYLYSPNRAVASMFNSRAREIAPRDPYLSERLSAGLGRTLSAQAQRRTDRLIMDPYVGPSGL